MLHQIIGNSKLQYLSKNYKIVFDRGNTQVSLFESVDEHTHLCVGDGVNLLLSKDWKDVSLVSGEVSSVDCLRGGLLYGLEVTTGNYCEGLGLITCAFGVCGN